MNSSWIRDASDAEFVSAVVERSQTVPVVVDFWAPWCGPCRMLGPLLEQEVSARAGNVELVKINTDENPAVATQLGIRSIPMVLGFRGGQAVSQLVGAQPLPAIRRFLDDLVPSQAEQTLAQAKRLVGAGKHAEAEPLARSLLEDARVASRAALLLAELLLDAGRVAELEPLYERISPREVDPDVIDGLRLRAQLSADSHAYGGEPQARAALARDEDDHEARWALAGALVAHGRLGESLDELLELVRRDRKFRDDGARRAMLALFARLGPDHDLTHEYRRRLQIYL